MPYKDPEAQRKAQRESVARRRTLGKTQPTIQARRKLLLEYIYARKCGPCVDCNKKYHPHLMDFDHVEGDKVCQVGIMANQRYSIAAIDAEIAKCELVCALCHRVRTWNRSHPDDQIVIHS